MHTQLEAVQVLKWSVELLTFIWCVCVGGRVCVCVCRSVWVVVYLCV